MLATRLLRLLQGSSAPEAIDDRPVHSIVRSAADRIGDPHAQLLVPKLEAQRISHAWQLKHFTHAHWEKIGGISLGLETAIHEVLDNPSIGHPNNSETSAVSADHDEAELIALLPERLRHFLLLPGPDGAPPKRLRALSCIMYGLCSMEPEARQQWALVQCELFALIGGLLMPLSLMYMRAKGSPELETQITGWPTVDDGMDALAMASFMFSVTAACNAVMIGVVVATTGLQPTWNYPLRLASALITLWAMFFGGLFSLLGLIMWHQFYVSTSPWPIAGVFLLSNFFLTYLDSFAMLSMLELAPLEIYHLPVAGLSFMAQVPGMKTWNGKFKMSDDVLRPKAEKRAAALWAQMKVQLIRALAENPGAAVSSGPAGSLLSTTSTAAPAAVDA